MQTTTMPRQPRNKPGRPRKGEAAPFARKVVAAREILVNRMPIATARDVFACSADTLYAWIRAACASDHPAAPAFRHLAELRGLIEPEEPRTP